MIKDEAMIVSRGKNLIVEVGIITLDLFFSILSSWSTNEKVAT